MDPQTIAVIDKSVLLQEAIDELVRVHQELLTRGFGTFRLNAKYQNFQLDQVETETNKIRKAVKSK